jgi:hypothetical protein
MRWEKTSKTNPCRRDDDDDDDDDDDFMDFVLRPEL